MLSGIRTPFGFIHEKGRLIYRTAFDFMLNWLWAFLFSPFKYCILKNSSYICVINLPTARIFIPGGSCIEYHH